MPPKIVPCQRLRTNVLNLPRLPIPALADTVRRYEANVRAIKKQSTIDAHMVKLKHFVQTDGDRIQKLLVEKDISDAESAGYPHSYIEAIWDDGYLKYRGPSPVNIAPGIVLKSLEKRIREIVDPANMATSRDDPRPDLQAHTAAQFVHAMLRFGYKMKHQGVDLADPPVDVSQLANQFGFTRLPREGRDSVQYFPLRTAMGHVVVLHRGRTFKVATRDSQGNYYTPGQLAVAFRNIVTSTKSQPALAVGALTGGSRDDWTSARKLLEKESPVNDASLHDIDSAFTVICLDTTVAGEDTQKLLTGALTGYAGGESSHASSKVADDIVNRWYDKHQLIFDPQGRVSGNYEHAFSDGMSWVRWKTEVIHAINGTTSPFAPLPQLPTVASIADNAGPNHFELRWELGEAKGPLGVSAANAAQVLNRLANSVALDAVRLPYGKKVVKKFAVSPDAFCQAAYHLAFFRQHGRLAPTYESCSTARFWHGRTETIRTATLPMYHLCAADEMAKGVISKGSVSSERKQALRAMMTDVSNKHVELAKEAAAGQGVDRHLLALRELCKQEKSESGLAFFNEHVYEFSGSWLLSTSNVSQPYIDLFDFGPVVGQGYGVGYNIEDDRVTATVSAFTGRETNARALAEGIAQAASDIAAVLDPSK